MLTLLSINAAAIAGFILLIWLISLPLRDASILDIAWGLGFVLIAWLSFAMTDQLGPNRWLLPLLTTIWGCRLAAHTGWRKTGEPEDRRYAKVREKWGKSFPLVSLFTVFAVQGVLIWIVSLPLQVGANNVQPGRGLLHFIGIAVWVVGFFFETVGDWQLARFKAKSNNEGEVCDEGLWRYTRHPNYFGDFCVWWGLFAIAISPIISNWTISWIVIGPITMSILLLRVSGVTMLEKDLKDRKPGYAAYVKRTNAFFPGRPG